MNKRISIIGCGWLGLPLASELIKNGHIIKGTTTSNDKIELLKKEGILPFMVSITERGIEGPVEDFLKDSEILIINIPPGLRKNPDTDFVKQMRFLCDAIEKSEIKKLLYVSSTSVYEDTFEIPTITEESQTNVKASSGKQLIAVEQLFKTNRNFETTILRFGGLIGENRHPATYLSGKKDLKDPESPVNLIHQEDCIGIIKAILKKDVWNTCFNAVAPQHPSKETYYTSICKEKNLPLPEFDHATKSKGKIISSKKLERILNYVFRHNL